MRRYISVFIIVLTAYIDLAIGQEKVVSQNTLNYKSIPQEKIFVHQNTSFLLSGEFLYYKVYCINSSTNFLSEISKIGYVELISSDKTIIFKHKIKLENGIGQGDFFVPSNIQSGNYKLTAYTQWMKKGEKHNYYQSDINIINPFIENQHGIFANSELDNSKEFHNSESYNIEEIGNNHNVEKDSLYVNLNAKIYAPREKVILSFDNLEDDKFIGDLSISVRKMNFFNSKKVTTKSYESCLLEDSTFKGVLILPELRGELIKGQVQNNLNESISNVKVVFSIPGNNYIFKIANTNSQGEFYFNLTENYNKQDAIIQIIGSNENLKIILDESKSYAYKKMDFEKLRIKSKFKDEILQQSINNQIENSYSFLRPNSFDEKKPNIPFYGLDAKEYILDEYTRFRTFKETIVEILDLVYIKQRGGVKSIHIQRSNETYESGLLPLILMDGRIVQDKNKLVDFKAKKIKKISVDREKRFYGTQLFDGIVSIETFDGVENEELFGDSVTNIKLFIPLDKRNYFKQIYDGSLKWDRIPDYRSQLLWEPNFVLNKETRSISFYTSDNIGDYEISIEGFTNSGNPISIRETFSVE